VSCLITTDYDLSDLYQLTICKKLKCPMPYECIDAYPESSGDTVERFSGDGDENDVGEPNDVEDDDVGEGV